MKLFGWKSGRDDTRPALSRVGAARFSATGEWPASYEAQVRAGYQENPVAMRAVKFVMDALAQAPLEPCDERAAALVGARSGGQALLATIAAHLLLHGNAYVQILRDAEGGVAELYALRPERVSGGRWRLSRLLRGRRGSEAAAGGHAVGERFVLLDPEALVSVELPLAALGGTARVLASGVGDVTGPAEAAAAIGGASVRPPSPVGLHWNASDDGGAVVGWTRRSRAGWRWGDGGDAPLVEESERYRVTIGLRTASVTGPSVVVTPAERAAGPVTVTVRQAGTLAESLPATIILPTS